MVGLMLVELEKELGKLARHIEGGRVPARAPCGMKKCFLRLARPRGRLQNFARARRTVARMSTLVSS